MWGAYGHLSLDRPPRRGGYISTLFKLSGMQGGFLTTLPRLTMRSVAFSTTIPLAALPCCRKRTGTWWRLAAGQRSSPTARCLRPRPLSAPTVVPRAVLRSYSPPTTRTALQTFSSLGARCLSTPGSGRNPFVFSHCTSLRALVPPPWRRSGGRSLLLMGRPLSGAVTSTWRSFPLASGRLKTRHPGFSFSIGRAWPR